MYGQNLPVNGPTDAVSSKLQLDNSEIPVRLLRGMSREAYH